MKELIQTDTNTCDMARKPVSCVCQTVVSIVVQMCP